MNFARSCWISSVVSAFSRAATASLKFIKLLLPAKLPKELGIYRQRLDVYALKGFSPLFFAEMLHLTKLTLLSKQKVNCTLKREIQPLLPICRVFCKHKTNFEIHTLKKTPFFFSNSLRWICFTYSENEVQRHWPVCRNHQYQRKSTKLKLRHASGFFTPIDYYHDTVCRAARAPELILLSCLLNDPRLTLVKLSFKFDDSSWKLSRSHYAREIWKLRFHSITDFLSEENWRTGNMTTRLP